MFGDLGSDSDYDPANNTAMELADQLIDCASMLPQSLHHITESLSSIVDANSATEKTADEHTHYTSMPPESKQEETFQPVKTCTNDNNKFDKKNNINNLSSDEVKMSIKEKLKDLNAVAVNTFIFLKLNRNVTNKCHDNVDSSSSNNNNLIENDNDNAMKVHENERELRIGVCFSLYSGFTVNSEEEWSEKEKRWKSILKKDDALYESLFSLIINRYYLLDDEDDDNFL